MGELGTIAAASTQLNISSPSLSTAISQLESEFGIQLFVRHHAQGLSLTPGGRRFLGAAKTIMENANALHDIANNVSEKIRGPVTIGCLLTLAPFILPELRSGFETKYSDAKTQQIEAHQADLFQMLRRSEIDMAITYNLEVPSDIEFLPLSALPPHAIFPPGHALAQETSVTLKSLEALPMVLLDLPFSREYFLSLFMDKGLKPQIAERTEHLSMVRTLVANGFGYSLLNVPSMNVHAPDGKPLCYVALEPDLRPMTMGIITMRSTRKPRIIKAFEEYCQTQITAKSAPGMTLF